MASFWVHGNSGWVRVIMGWVVLGWVVRTRSRLGWFWVAGEAGLEEGVLVGVLE